MDKNKIIEAAGKLVAKGAYDKAIKEYQKVLETDSKDVRVLQKMGELFQKKNDNVQAAVYFTKVAESYSTDGFFLKAVALYKQVLKLDPSLMDINVRLAELHQQLQLLSEAMAYYQIVANHFDKAGDVKKSLSVLKKMVDLDPDNVASRVKLADLYVREGLKDEASGEFQRAAEHLKRTNRIDDYLRVADRIAALEPDNLKLQRELAELYIQRGDQKKALAKLQVCFKADPRDIDTLKLLAVAFQGLGQTSKTLSVFKELARAYEDRGQSAEAQATWKQIEEIDPHDGEVVARRTPAPVTAPSRPAAAPAAAAPAAPPPPPVQGGSGLRPQPAGTPNLGKLLTETDVYVKYGLHDKALEHLRKVFTVDPENIDAHEKAYDIYVGSNNQGQAFEQLLNVLRLHTRSGAAQRAQPYLASMLQLDPGHAEVPAFLAALKLEGVSGAAVTPDEEVADEAILVDSSDDEVIVAEEPDTASSAEVTLSSAEMLQPEDVGMSPEDAAVAAQYEEEEAPGLQDEAVYSDTAVLPDTEAGIEPIDVPLGTQPGARSPFTAPSSQPFDEAAAAALGEEETPAEPTREHSAPLALTEPAPAWPAPTLYDGGETEHATPEPAAVVEEAVEAPPEDEPAQEECDEATFFVEQGLWEEAREILETVLIAYPEHRRAAALMAQVEAGSGPASATVSASPADAERDAFDLAHELAEELDELGADSPSAAPATGQEYQVSVEEVFAEFKKGLEKVVKPGDVDTHYDLGIAYKEMGLTDDAISEFEVARKGCIGKKKEIDCLTMIGMLGLQKGDVPGAIDAYLQALASEHAAGEAEKALRFELAAAYEAGEKPGRALAQYLKVQALDDGYRDVGERVAALAASTQPEEEGKPVRAGRKVGFI